MSAPQAASAASHCTPDVRQEATGGIEAQNVIRGLGEGALSPLHAWLALATLAARYGWRSPACMAFVVELAKRASDRVKGGD